METITSKLVHGMKGFEPHAESHNPLNAYWLSRVCEAVGDSTVNLENTFKQWGLDQIKRIERENVRAVVATGERLSLLIFHAKNPPLPGEIESPTCTDTLLAGQVLGSIQKPLLTIWPHLETLTTNSRTFDTSDSAEKTDEKAPQKPLWIAGHGWGAAWATLAAAQFASKHKADDTRPAFDGLYTFGSPRCGDPTFSDTFNDRLGKRVFRYANEDDPLTTLPSQSQGFKHVGQLKYFDAEGQLHENAKFWDKTLIAPETTADTHATSPLPSHHSIKQYVANLQQIKDMAHEQKPEKKEWGAVFAGLMVLILFGVGIFSGWNKYNADELEIIASATLNKQGTTWKVEGKILEDGKPVTSEASVWMVAKDNFGHSRYYPAQTENGGGFRVDGIPKSLTDAASAPSPTPDTLAPDASAPSSPSVPPSDGASTTSATSPKPVPDKNWQHVQADLRHAQAARHTTTVEVHASTPGWLNWLGNIGSKEGRTKLQLNRESTSPNIRYMYGFAIVMAGVFILGICFMLLPGPWELSVKYYGSLVLALLIAVGMVCFIGYMQHSVSSMVKRDGKDVLALGFANIYAASYQTESDTHEWVISLTAPPTVRVDDAGNTVPQANGFGAPLWVILLSVVGAGLFTVALLVREIRHPPDFDACIFIGDKGPPCTPSQFRRRVQKKIEDVVQHQFFILFAPLGGIFVYQTLEVADATSQPVMVAVSVLSAGVLLNDLLDRALKKTTSLLKSS